MWRTIVGATACSLACSILVAVTYWKVLTPNDGAGNRQTIQLGNVLPGRSTESSLKLRNRESLKIKLVNSQVTCGCLNTTIGPETLATGEEATVHTTLKHPWLEGDFIQHATFVFQAGDKEVVYTIDLAGHVVPWVTVAPAEIDFDRQSGESKFKSLATLSFADEEFAENATVSCSNTALATRILPEDSPGQRILELEFDPNGTAASRVRVGYVYLGMKVGTGLVSVPYRITLDSQFEVEPPVLALSILTIGVDKTIPVRLRGQAEYGNESWRLVTSPGGVDAEIVRPAGPAVHQSSQQEVLIRFRPMAKGIYNGHVDLIQAKSGVHIKIPCSYMVR
jgi:hypothetical protein